MDNSKLWIFYVIFFAGMLIFSLLINGLLLKFAKTLGIRNNTNTTIIRWGSTAKPAMGGIGFYIVFLISYIGLSFDAFGIQFLHSSQTLGILLAATVGFFTGLFDDAYNTRPWLKFAGQALCAIILITSGLYISFFSQDYLNYLLTIFWVVGMMNSINMLDNMDAISSVTSLGILSSMLAVVLLYGNIGSPFVLIIIAIIAALIGFLFYNWSPSKIYMGDTGSQFLGVLLAALGISLFWNHQVAGEQINKVYIVLVIATAFILPLTDTTTVFIKRIAKGKSPFIGGRDHTSHHLSYLGLSDAQVAIFFLALSFIAGGFTTRIFCLASNWMTIYWALFAAFPILVFAFLFWVALTSRPKKSQL